MDSPAKKTVILLCGPTAVGKTAVSIQLAKHYKTEIISADSRQCFKELNIGVARPSAKELQAVPHHFIASHSIQDEVTAVTFEQYALQKTKELFQQYDTVIMVGGTGLYIKAFCEGLDEMPELRSEIRSQIVEKYKQYGMPWLKEEIKVKDPAFYAAGEIQNPQRMMRALEVILSTGQSILSFRKGEKAKRDFNIVKTGLELPMDKLQRNINARVDAMIEAGLQDEVKALADFKGLNALQTVGYAELFDYFAGTMSLPESVEQIKTHTRQYAKRQMTWFRKDATINWFEPGEIKKIITYIELAREAQAQ